ncbi:MAG TPA: PstS family phosphate ABC transporter substrate-binding protein [Polyangiaceae bacterium]|nr:PstS family phosphate ABC transporter substrate-binding protein [Polyangiaceae bacterium]
MTTKYSLAVALAGIAAVGCSKSEQRAPSPEPSATAAANEAPAAEKAVQDRSAQTIAIDGSSTVFPISEAMAEEFQKKRAARVTVATSGTGGGFKKFCAKEIAIADASRPIKATEAEACKAAGIDYIELPIAFDGIAVMVNPKNKWVDKMTVEELKKLWEPEAQNKVKTWADIRKGWPKEEIHLFGPGVDSGTYDYFTAAIVGQEHKSRGDFTSSEDDNVLVKGIASDKLALGFFGFAYYEENKDSLKLVPIDDGVKENGEAPVLPSHETIEKGTYQPLSRPIFIYVSRPDADRKEVQDFVDFYLGDGVKLIEEVGYIKLPADAYKLGHQRFEKRKTGSVFAGGSKVGVTVTELLAKE